MKVPENTLFLNSTITYKNNGNALARKTREVLSKGYLYKHPVG